LCVCGGRAVSEPYYSQRARNVLRLSERFFILPRDARPKRGTSCRPLFLRLSVCLSVCLSVTFVCCIQMAKDIIKLFLGQLTLSF